MEASHAAKPITNHVRARNGANNKERVRAQARIIGST
jgi:hypothetical protein